MSWVVRTQENWGWGERDLRIGRNNFDGTFSVVEPFTFKTFKASECIDTITVQAGTPGLEASSLLQAIVDHAADIGIFPTNKTPPTKELDALRYHLEDMRKLVFKEAK